MEILYLIALVASFLVTYLLMPFWIKKARSIGLVWRDMNKYEKKMVAGSGGIIAVLAFIIGVLLYVAYRTFILNTDLYLVEILALLTAVLFLSGVGLIDDLLGWQKGGLRRRYRILLVALASIPLIAINAGRPEIYLPIFGAVDLSFFYVLVMIPIGFIGATTTFNFLAGFNGLEAGQGVILLLALSLVSYSMGNSWLAIIALCMVASLIAFLFYNRNPSKVFPGDSLTYSIGGLVAIIAILGDFEKVATFFFIPYIIEFILKSRGKLGKYSFGKPNKDGSLDLMYGKIYSLNHFSILIMKRLGIKPTEKRATYMILGLQIVVVIIGIVIFREGIFLR